MYICDKMVGTIRFAIQILLNALRPNATLKQEVSEYIYRTIITSFPRPRMDGYRQVGLLGVAASDNPDVAHMQQPYQLHSCTVH